VSELFAVIGAGPSLNFCLHELADLDARGAHFLISDSVAAAVLGLVKPRNATVFTVEARRHSYLRRIGSACRFDVAAYRNAPPRNLRLTNNTRISRFRLAGEEGSEPALYSPGTVLGTMLSYAASAISAEGEIHLIGADFCYIDNQVYARFIEPHAPRFDRLVSREMWQLEMAYKKTAAFLSKAGHALRTSFELLAARENMRAFVAKLPHHIRLCEYSPIGLDCERVQKMVPQALPLL